MNLNGDYATIFNNLLLGETPPVEVRFAGFIRLVSTQGGRHDTYSGRAQLNSMCRGVLGPDFCAVFTCRRAGGGVRIRDCVLVCGLSSAP